MWDVAHACTRPRVRPCACVRACACECACVRASMRVCVGCESPRGRAPKRLRSLDDARAARHHVLNHQAPAFSHSLSLPLSHSPSLSLSLSLSLSSRRPQSPGTCGRPRHAHVRAHWAHGARGGGDRRRGVALLGFDQSGAGPPATATHACCYAPLAPARAAAQYATRVLLGQAARPRDLRPRAPRTGSRGANARTADARRPDAAAARVQDGAISAETHLAPLA